MRPLDLLFSAPEQKLMVAVLGRPGADFGTLELLERMGSSRSAGSSLLQRWVDSGLLRERRVGNQRRLSVNPDFLLYPELRSMLGKTVGIAQPLAAALVPLAEHLRHAFVFGSVADGTDTSESDIDLVLVGDIDMFGVSPLMDKAQRELGRPVHLNIYSPREWSSTRDPVLKAIKAGPRIDLMEAIHEQTR